MDKAVFIFGLAVMVISSLGFYNAFKVDIWTYEDMGPDAGPDPYDGNIGVTAPTPWSIVLVLISVIVGIGGLLFILDSIKPKLGVE